MQLVRLVTAHRTAVALRELQARPGATLSDAALVVGAASTADRVAVIRGWRAAWEPTGTGARGWVLCTLGAHLDVVVHDRRGDVLWQGVGNRPAEDVLTQ